MLSRIVQGLEAIWASAELATVAVRLQAGVRSSNEWRALRGELEALGGSASGFLGPYKIKMVCDYIVASGLVQSNAVVSFPVASNGGTLASLRKVFGAVRPGEGEEALRQLFALLSSRGLTTHRDNLGTIGGLCCWWHRSMCNRLERTTASTQEDIDLIQAQPLSTQRCMHQKQKGGC
jgi:hypothetical protein